MSVRTAVVGGTPIAAKNTDAPGKVRPKRHLIIPAVIALTFLVDVGLRLWCPAFVYFRAWEALHRNPLAEGSFDPLTFVRSERAYGDLAHMSNMPQFRQIRSETF